MNTSGPTNYEMRARFGRNNILSFIYNFSLLFIFIFYSFFENKEFFLYPFIGIVALLFFFYFLLGKKIRIKGDKGVLLYSAFGLSVLFLFGQIFWDSNISSFVLVAPMMILILLEFCNYAILRRCLSYFLLLIVVLASWEKLTGEYLFTVNFTMADGTNILLDESLFTGAGELLRAKSVFLGPLSLSLFLIGTSIILRENRIALFLCLIGAIFSVSRSGMFLVSFVIFISLLNSKNQHMKRRVTIFSLMMLMLILLLLDSSALLNRLLDGLDFSGGSATNNARMYFWFSGISEYINYSWFQSVFGNVGYFRFKYNNNAESGWLTLLLDFGFVGFLLYFFPMLRMFLRIQSLEKRLIICVVFVANAVFTFSYGVIGCFMYWFILHSLAHEESLDESRNYS